MKLIFAFLGGIRFAIFLIALTVVFVISGTILESQTQSHKYAAIWTYNNPVFTALLWGYFVNILFSALRRWPFKAKHVPFLITHLGLLMILGGVMIKNAFGTQGSMVIAEGSGSNEIFTNEPGLLVEYPGGRHSVPLPKNRSHSVDINDLNIRIARYAPHAIERYSAWIKGPHAFILGLNPFVVQKDAEDKIPISGKVRFQGPESEIWTVRAVKTDKPLDKNRINNKEIWIFEDAEGLNHFCCRNEHGDYFSEAFNPEKLNKYIVYDRGYGGYTIPVKVPLGDKEIQLEAALSKVYKEMPLPVKLEEQRPVVTLELTQHENREFIILGYDSQGTNLKWPGLNGKYLLRFQPVSQKIPYFIRLHNARQINYANSNQPFSYESDIAVIDERTNTTLSTTLRMNHVHETWDGYRFYMSSISPSDQSAVHRVQIVVNHDPAKYWLTYPGAIILSLGIVLLFWLQPYRTKPS